MKMLMSYQREELERLRVCAIEQATTIDSPCYRVKKTFGLV